MLGFYIDPCGDERNALACALVANEEQWDALYPAWNEVLAMAPPLPFWHASAAWSGKEWPFDLLSREQREERESLLAKVILEMDPSPCGIGVSMPMALYEAEMKGRIVAPEGVYKPRKKKDVERLINWEHSSLFAALMGLIFQYLDRFDVKENVKIVVERDSPARDAHFLNIINRAIQYFGEKGDKKAHLITDVDFLKGKDPATRPLEAIDLYAWCRLRLLSRRSGPDVIELPKKLPWGALEVEAEPMRKHIANFQAKAWRSKGDAGI